LIEFSYRIERGIVVTGEGTIDIMGVRNTMHISANDTNPVVGLAQRGVVVSIYLDPDNEEGSTQQILEDLELTYDPVLQ
jgi:hypothetical protein